MAAQIAADTNSQVMEKFQQPTIYAVVGVRPAQSGPRSQYLIQQQHSIYTGQGTATGAQPAPWCNNCWLAGTRGKLIIEADPSLWWLPLRRQWTWTLDTAGKHGTMNKTLMLLMFGQKLSVCPSAGDSRDECAVLPLTRHQEFALKSIIQTAARPRPGPRQPPAITSIHLGPAIGALMQLYLLLSVPRLL